VSARESDIAGLYACDVRAIARGVRAAIAT
jgi:hypothetical protein